MPRTTILIISYILGLWTWQAAGAKTPISPELFHTFKRYVEISAATYGHKCPHLPQGLSVAVAIENARTNTEGFIAIDKAANELVVALRGSDNLPDFLTDVNLFQVPLETHGVDAWDCPGCKVHNGFLKSWDSVAKDTVRAVKIIMKGNPGMRVSITGHSLGAALASLAAMSFIGSGIDVTTYTFGQPRTGNKQYADFVDRQAPPETMFRVTHANDGVPQILFREVGYHHHSTEYWQPDKPVASRTFECRGQESGDCNNSVVGLGINAAHMEYLGIPIGRPTGDRGADACGSKRPNAHEVVLGFLGAPGL